MKALVRWIPAPILMLATALLGLLAVIFLGLPLLALLVASGIVGGLSFVWALISLAGAIFGQPHAAAAFATSLCYCAAAITVSACVFYYGTKGWRLLFGRRDVAFNAA